MFHSVLPKDEADLESEEQGPQTDIIKHKEALMTKIKFVARMAKMQKLLREERENIILIKQLNNDQIPQGLLIEGKEAIEQFMVAKMKDSNNEKRPAMSGK